MKRIIFLFLVLASLYSCADKKKPENRFSDKELQKIFTYQYNRQSDSLYPYFRHPNPEYRKEAALSFSSIGDTLSIEKLYFLLRDPDNEVRKAASFSLGQYKNPKSIDTLIKYSEIEVNSEVNQFILEAIGRCANSTGLGYLVNYVAKDSIDKAGVAWGIFRACRRQVVSEQGTKKMSDYLSDKEAFEVSLASAFYFVYSKVPVDPYIDQLFELAGNTKYVEVKMAAIRSLRNSKKTECADFLINTLKNATDYRLRVDAINTLRFFPYDYCNKFIWDALNNDRNISVQVSSAEYFEYLKNPSGYKQYIEQAENTSNWRIRTLLLNAAMTSGVNYAEVSGLLKKHYSNTSEYLEKQSIISSLAEYAGNFDFIATAFKKETYGEILYTYSEALFKIHNSKDFKKQDEAKLASLFVGLINSDNKYLIIQGLIGIMNPESNIMKYFPDSEYLLTAKKNSINKFNKNDISYQLFDLALAYYSDPETRENSKLINDKISRYTGYTPILYKPIDWISICSIARDAKVIVKTEKGDFTIRLLVEETPFSVNAFLDGVKNSLFDSLQFYRIVPNFVNQTGGTMDAAKDSLANLYIRSEYNIRRHREGTVNMASYGRDTETTHFSIMLCPTPWNDNSYTIFGVVTEGMDIVHNLESGDYIISIKETNSQNDN